MMPEPDAIRHLLGAARPSGKDEQDPEILAARDALRNHPELAAELETERLADFAISQSYQSAQVPPELEARLLASLREARRQAAVLPGKVIPISFGRRRLLATVAAALGLTAAGGVIWWRDSKLLKVHQLVADLARISREGVTLSLMSMDTAEVVEWLRQNEAPRAAQLPPALDGLGRKGCHIYQIEGRRVSLECFLLPGMRELHLFTTPSRSLSGAPSPSAAAQVHADGEMTAAIWSQGENTMVLLSEEPAEAIKKLLQV